RRDRSKRTVSVATPARSRGVRCRGSWSENISRDRAATSANSPRAKTGDDPLGIRAMTSGKDRTSPGRWRRGANAPTAPASLFRLRKESATLWATDRRRLRLDTGGLPCPARAAGKWAVGFLRPRRGLISEAGVAQRTPATRTRHFPSTLKGLDN